MTRATTGWPRPRRRPSGPVSVTCTNNVVPLTPLAGGSATANNDRHVHGTDVDAAANKIALPRNGTVNNTFELGQAVVFHAPSVEFTSGDVLGSTILLADHGFTSGDAVTYVGVGLPASTASGTLEDGTTYYVIAVDTDHIELSETLNGTPLVLVPDNSTAGKTTVVHKLTRAIEGLVDGGTYYVAASTGQTNLQGNTRFTETQVIGLSELENESRAGVLDRHRSRHRDRIRAVRKARARFRLCHRTRRGFAAGRGKPRVREHGSGEPGRDSDAVVEVRGRRRRQSSRSAHQQADRFVWQPGKRGTRCHRRLRGDQQHQPQRAHRRGQHGGAQVQRGSRSQGADQRSVRAGRRERHGIRCRFRVQPGREHRRPSTTRQR